MKKLFFLFLLLGIGTAHAVPQYAIYKTFTNGSILSAEDLMGIQNTTATYINSNLLNGGVTLTVLAGDSLLVRGRIHADTTWTGIVYLNGNVVVVGDGLRKIGASGTRLDSLFAQYGAIDTARTNMLSIRDSLSMNQGLAKILGITMTASTTGISNALTITSTIDLTTDQIDVADGGTGASSAANARTNLGVAIGSDVQAYIATIDKDSSTAAITSGSITGTTFNNGVIGGVTPLAANFTTLKADSTWLGAGDFTLAPTQNIATFNVATKIVSTADTMLTVRASGSQTISHALIDGSASSGTGRASLVINAKSNKGSSVEFLQGSTQIWAIGAGAAADSTLFEMYSPAWGGNALTLTVTGNVVVGKAALATTVTDGFLFIPSCAGTPTGVPTTYTGRTALVYDSTNNLLYANDGGGWVAVNSP